MIQVTNDFLPQNVFLDLQDYCFQNVFKNIVLENNRQISYIETPPELLEFLQIKDHNLILTFIRNANPEIDTLLNVNADNTINDKKVSLASVLYINQYNDCEINGTAFYNHEKCGQELSNDISNEDIKKLLIEDANDISKWSETNRVKNFPNRYLVYNANMFNAKYPSKLSFGNRITLHTFYTKKQ